MRPPRIGTDASNAGTRPAILDTGLLRRVPHLPPALVDHLVLHKGHDVLKCDPGLLEARSDDHSFTAGHHQRPVQRCAGDDRQQSRLAVAPGDGQGRRLHTWSERTADKAALPGQYVEGMP